MLESEIDERISNYWAAKCRLLDIEQQQRLDEIVEGLGKRGFINPTEEDPIQGFEMASWLDPKPLREFFKPSYKNFSIVEDRLDPRIRFLAAICLSRASTLMDAYRKMISGELYKALGFPEIPTYELLREFVNERVGVERLPEFFDSVLMEIARQAGSYDIVVGRRVGQDATDTHSLKHDPEATYSGYYKHCGYKADVTHDLDDPTIPLHYTPMALKADEGKNLIPAQEHLRDMGLPLQVHKVDGSYAKSYKNIAWSEIHGTRLIYRIQEGWVHSDKGTAENVKRVYQRYHNEEDFRVGADLPFMLLYLSKKEEWEVVGAYYRNQRMEFTEQHPEEARKETGERSGKTEGFFSVTKGTTLLDGRPRRRGWREFLRRCGLSMLAHLFAALIRLQHGVVRKLGCLTHIT